MMVANVQAKTGKGEDETADNSQSLLELRVGSLLDPGLKRRNRPNEDGLFVALDLPSPATVPVKPFALFVVADSMGGHVNGQEASHLAIASLLEYVYTALRSKQIISEDRHQQVLNSTGHG